MTNTTAANVTIVISNNADALAAANPSHTVEAEYGSILVHGPMATMAHHGANSGNPCPCLGDNITSHKNPTIGVSHFDLDTLGGVMRCLGVKEYDGEDELFWKLAAWVDINGPHKLEMAPVEWYQNELLGFALAELNAFWAWSEDNRLFAPRDGSVLDCTEFFLEAIRIVGLILEGDDLNEEAQTILQTGKDWAASKEALAEESLKIIKESIAVRSSDQFTNHLYETPGEICRAVVAFNEKFKSVTVSLADPIAGVSCCDIVQALWGKEAGGHAGIAGSPRGREMTWDDCLMAAEAVNKAIN